MQQPSSSWGEAETSVCFLTMLINVYKQLNESRKVILDVPGYGSPTAFIWKSLLKSKCFDCLHCLTHIKNDFYQELLFI